MPLVEPLPKELTEKNRLADRQRERSWQAEQQTLTMASPQGSSALRIAAHERPRSFVQAMGLVVDRSTAAPKSPRKLSRPRFLTPSAQNLFARTEKMVVHYASEGAVNFGKRLGQVGFLKRETEAVLVDECRGWDVWKHENRAFLVHPKLCWEDEDHKRSIMWNVRCWIASRIYERLQDLEQRADPEVEGSPIVAKRQRQARGGGNRKPSSDERVKETTQLTDVESPQLVNEKLPQPIDEAMGARHFEEVTADESDDMPGQQLLQEQERESKFMRSTAKPKKRKRSPNTATSDSVGSSRPPVKRQKRNTPKAQGCNPTPVSDGAHRPRRRRSISDRRNTVSSLTSVECFAQSPKLRNTLATKYSFYKRWSPTNLPMALSATLPNEPTASSAFSDPKHQRQLRTELATNIRYIFRMQPDYEHIVRVIFPTIAALSEDCEFSKRDHRLYAYWTEVRKSVTAWRNMALRLDIFRRATKYKSQSPAAWTRHLSAQSLDNRLLYQSKMHDLLAWGKERGLDSADFQASWCPDLAIILDALLGPEYLPIDFEKLVLRLESYNKDLVDWFRYSPHSPSDLSLQRIATSSSKRQDAGGQSHANARALKQGNIQSERGKNKQSSTKGKLQDANPTRDEPPSQGNSLKHTSPTHNATTTQPPLAESKEPEPPRRLSGSIAQWIGRGVEGYSLEQISKYLYGTAGSHPE